MSLLQKDAWESQLVQKVMLAIEDPSALKQPLLDDSNINIIALLGIDQDAPEIEQQGFDIMSQLAGLCKKGSGIFNNLRSWAKRELTALFSGCFTSSVFQVASEREY